MTEPGRVLADRYELREPLGRGGMGTVWLADDRLLGRQVAIKELLVPDGGGELAARTERVLREARAAAKVGHPGVIAIYDVLDVDGLPWIVMKYVPSRSAEDRIASDGPFPVGEAARIGLTLLDALRAVHAQGVLHRDVKPGNVLLGAEGAVLTDFGIALGDGDPRLTGTGLLIGSPGFIAPERLRGEQAGPASDLWSLGATLYTMVEGGSPFDRPTAAAMIAAVLTEPPPAPRLAGPMAPVLLGLLEKDPAQRLSGEAAMARLAALPGKSVPATKPLEPVAPSPAKVAGTKPTRIWPVVTVMAALVTLFVVVGFTAPDRGFPRNLDACKLFGDTSRPEVRPGVSPSPDRPTGGWSDCRYSDEAGEYVWVKAEHFPAGFFHGGPSKAEDQLNRLRERAPGAEDYPEIAADQAFREGDMVTFRLKNFVVQVSASDKSVPDLPKWVELVRDHLPS